jgi:hypothetical protein
MGWDTFWDNFSQTHMVTLTIVYTCPKRLWCLVVSPPQDQKIVVSNPRL